ncbi:Alg9-like mannosyltransferase family-domain-containing protein [Gamsiella multidivaricata]|uniref:Alg9-like mannosyltransferase family-domain-containing protein n=1 Tax=Gamsiella multidivaricata TaxID=101098 RepID=UPI00221F0DFE|nr:Alg9-like mannosyltransferase family-domain-containing protein [Gamsiella multidivaricata]KAI7821568.1 Alg9-like mannosyltransferase family-domain-containing protein [Gamsiella multidivaricata]
MPPIMRKQQRSDTAILAGLVVFRAINASLVKTFFSPDEYWQALEVGHRITFGYGYLTWEWDVGLRSALHPALFAGLYKALYMLGIDDGSLFIYAPRLLQSVFAAVADFYAYRFAYRLFENQVTANWTLFLSVISWWNFFCSTRTLANSMEAALTIVALYYWPFTSVSPSTTSATSNRPVWLGSLRISLAIAFLTCIFRPTAAIMWLFLGASLLIEYVKAGDIYSTMSTLANVAVIGGSAVLGSAILDSALIYPEWTLTPLNFLRVNVLEGISLFYGSSPWHWYISQGLPLLFGTHLPLALLGFWHTWKASTGLNATLKRQILYLSLWMLVVYSSLQHKEWRFLYPILYPLLPFAGDTLYRWFLSVKGWRNSRVAVTTVVGLVVVNAIMAWYTATIHQRGVVDVMKWIREEGSTGQIRSAGFLMPCHSTPWFSNIHRRNTGPLDIWFVTCEPPLGDIDSATYKDESDIFYEDPVAFMNDRATRSAQKNLLKDSHLVLFEDLLRSWPDMPLWLESRGYHECARFFNSHFHDDRRRRGDVLVYCSI